MKNEGEGVKRFLCTLMVLCLIPVFAVAETFDMSVLLYNAYASEIGLKELPQTFTTEKEENGKERRTFNISDTIKYIYFIENDDVYMCGVVCLSKDSYIEYLATCVCGVFSVNTKDCLAVASSLIQDFYLVYSGNDEHVGYTANGVYKISNIGGERTSFLYTSVKNEGD